MRHRVFGKKLGRDYDHRRALFKNLARGFLASKGRIRTTLAKAKAVQPLIERIISRAGRGDLASRRWLFRHFQDQHLVNEIVNSFGEHFKERKGGYTRIVKLKRRKGDDAVIVRLEVVEELKSKEKTAKARVKKKKEVKKEKIKSKSGKNENIPAKSKRD